MYIPSPNAVKLQVCNLTSVSFRRHFIVCSHAERVKLVVGYFEPAVVLNTRNIRTRQDVGVTDNC